MRYLSSTALAPTGSYQAVLCFKTSWASHPRESPGRSHWLRRLTKAALRFNARPVAEQKYHYPRTCRCPERNNLSFAVVSYRSLPLLRGDPGVPAVWLFGPVNVPENLFIQLSKFSEGGLRNSSFEEPLHYVRNGRGKKEYWNL